MGFFDNLKKAGEYAQKGLEQVDETIKRNIKRASVSELKDFLRKHPNNKYAIEELRRRGEL